MTRRRRVWTRDEVAQLYALYEWSTLEQVGRVVGISRERVRQLFERFGFRTRISPTHYRGSYTRNPALLDAQLAMRIAAIYDQHPRLMAKWAAKRVGVPVSAVRYHARRLGIRLPSGPEPWLDAEMLCLLRIHHRHGATWWLANAAPLGYPGVTVYQHRFGSWNAARHEAGLATVQPGHYLIATRGGRRRRFHRTDLIAFLQRHPAATTEWWRKHAPGLGYPALGTYYRYFGSWPQARAVAGLAPLRRGRRAPQDTEAQD